VVIQDLVQHFEILIEPHLDHIAQSLFQAAVDKHEEDVILAFAALFFKCPERVGAYAADALNLALDVLRTNNPTLVAAACILAGDVMRCRHRQFLTMIGALIDEIYSLMLSFPNDYQLLAQLLSVIAAIVCVSPEEAAADDAIGALIGEALLPSRFQLMVTFSSLQNGFQIAEYASAENLLLSLLRIYRAFALIYDAEAGQDVNGRKQPGEFLAQFVDDFKALIVNADKARLGESDAVLEAFVDFCPAALTAFRSFKGFSVKIHHLEFKTFFESARRSRNRIVREKAEVAYKIWYHS
jgi:hypothetical protein